MVESGALASMGKAMAVKSVDGNYGEVPQVGKKVVANGWVLRKGRTQVVYVVGGIRRLETRVDEADALKLTRRTVNVAVVEVLECQRQETWEDAMSWTDVPRSGYRCWIRSLTTSSGHHAIHSYNAHSQI